MAGRRGPRRPRASSGRRPTSPPAEAPRSLAAAPPRATSRRSSARSAGRRARGAREEGARRAGDARVRDRRSRGREGAGRSAVLRRELPLGARAPASIGSPIGERALPVPGRISRRAGYSLVGTSPTSFRLNSGSISDRWSEPAKRRRRARYAPQSLDREGRALPSAPGTTAAFRAEGSSGARGKADGLCLHHVGGAALRIIARTDRSLRATLGRSSVTSGGHP